MQRMWRLYSSTKRTVLLSGVQDAMESQAWLLYGRTGSSNTRSLFHSGLRKASARLRYVSRTFQEAVEVRRSAHRQNLSRSEVHKVRQGVPCEAERRPLLPALLLPCVLLRESSGRTRQAQCATRSGEAGHAALGGHEGHREFLCAMPRRASRRSCGAYQGQARFGLTHARESAISAGSRESQETQPVLVSFPRSDFLPPHSGRESFAFSLNRCAPMTGVANQELHHANR